jgi:integral membrane sensor domain MASE1
MTDGLYRAPDGGALYLQIAGGRVEGYVRDGGRGAGEPAGGLRSLEVLAGFAAATAVVALANLFSALARLRTEPRETPSQTLASAISIAASGAWLAALIFACIFVAGGLGAERLLRSWPNSALLASSWLALCGAVLTLCALVQSPGVWREGRRVHGWSIGRKLAHAATLLLFLAFAVVLTAWGGLEPWSS